MISIFIATAGRPNFLHRMLESLRRTTSEYDIEITAVVDENRDCVYLLEEYGAEVIDFGKSKRGALWAWNRALQLSDGDILVPAGDDQLFHDGWLDFALESFANKLDGYGVLGMNDLAYDGNKQLATMWMFDRKYCKDHMGGVFAPPMYHYYCIDSEWNEKAKMLGRYYWENRAIVEHLHSAHGKRELDALDRVKMGTNWMEEDNETYKERKANSFPVTWEPII